MNSKILIDWNEVPMITVKLPVVDPRPKNPFNVPVGSVSLEPYEVAYDDLDDARDKLTYKFINSGPFALIAGTDVGTYEIHSMNALDVMQNILDIYGKMFPVMSSRSTDPNQKKFTQAVYEVCSMIEHVSGERSTAFDEKVEAQKLG